jgi:PAS domain S-box-containing protein
VKGPPAQHPAASLASVTPAPASDDGPINILIVDHEPKSLSTLEAVLDNPAYRLTRADSANQALCAIVQEEYALLIMDIRLPDMSGVELAQLIRDRRNATGVPIIFLTAAYREDQQAIETYGSGAVDYLSKPVNAIILRSKVAVFAELYRKSRECETANLALITEITERRRVEGQLRDLNETLERLVVERTEALATASVAVNATSERYRSIFDGSLDAVFSLGTGGHFEAANPAALRLTGRTLEELKSLTFLDLCAPDQKEAVENALLASWNRESFMMDTVVLTAGGERCDLFISGTPVIVGGKVVDVSCIAHDITVRKVLDRALQETNIALENARLAAEDANRAKSDFLSSMSHELRSPLNAILGFAQLLNSSSQPPTQKQKSSVDQILKAGWYLLEMINEILDLALIESGKLSLSLEPVSLAQVLNDCKDMIEPQAQKKGISVTFPLMDRPWVVKADRRRLQQVLINLFSNAIKYNRPAGSVEVVCTVMTPTRKRVSFHDSGVGLSPAMLAQLFQPFNRLGRETGAEEGTGIGLVLTRRLVELMGGTVGVESTVGVGSVFWIELNATVDSTHARPTAARSIATGSAKIQHRARMRTLLYFEDNLADLELVRQLIADRPDIRLLSAPDGNEGVQIARAEQPDVILMDINLAGISGIEAISILRNDPVTANIPVVALSANAMVSDVAMGQQAGFFQYLTKPIKLSQLMATLEAALDSGIPDDSDREIHSK